MHSFATLNDGRRRLPISLVVAAYSPDTAVRAAISSVCRQAYVPAEIIVVDTAASGQTRDSAAAAGARVIPLPHDSGPGTARNLGVAAAHERWVAFLDADDVWHDGKLYEQWQAICRWPDAAFCFADYDIAYPNGDALPRAASTDPGYLLATVSERAGNAVRFHRVSFARALVHSMFVCRSTVIVNREIFIRSGGYDERLGLGEDAELFFRLLRSAPAIAVERSLATNREPVALSARRFVDEGAIRRIWTAIFEQPAPPAGKRRPRLSSARFRTNFPRRDGGR